jgi:phosphoribosylamine--glycine ligase
MDFEKIATAAKSGGFDFVMVGPEAPLVGGLVDYCAQRGVLACGPNREASELTEGSKIKFKYLAAEANVPSASFYVCERG